MEAIIVNFRRGRHRTNPRQIIIKVASAKPKELIKKTVTFKTSSGKEIKGTISAKHGNKDCFRAIFTQALPGQSIGRKVIIS